MAHFGWFRMDYTDMNIQSSLLQGLIGEMKKISGDVTFGGRVSYCAQTAWIQNATLVMPLSCAPFFALGYSFLISGMCLAE